MTETPIKKSFLFIPVMAITIAISLLLGCGGSEMKDFSLDTIEAQPEARLKILADTSIILPQIARYASVEEQLDSLLYYAEWVKNYEEDAALLYAQMAYDLATEENLNFSRAVAAYRIAALKGKRAKFGEDIEDAMVDARISQRLMSEFNRPDWEIPINSLLGVLYNRTDKIEIARHYFQLALSQLDDIKILPKIKNENKAAILANLGTTYYMQDSIKKSYYYQKSDSLYQLTGNQTERVQLWRDWGRFNQYYKNYRKADSLYNLCINYGLKESDNYILANAYQFKGRMYHLQHASTDSSLYFDKAIKTLQTSLKYENEKAFQYLTYQYIGATFHNSLVTEGPPSHADSAVYYYKTAMIKAGKEGASRTLENISYNILDVCSDTSVRCDSIRGENVTIFINDNYKTLLKTLTTNSKDAFKRINKVEQRDIQVNAANTRRNQLYIGLGILGVVGGIFLFLFQGQQNRRLKAEMEALRAQINPHFISNSLNAIESLVNLGNAKAAAKYLVHFSRLSRQILNGSRTATTSLTQELKTLKHFLALEQLRFRDKLTYDIQVAPALNQDLVSVPAMILQPYVENAIWHGIKPKAEGGHIIIHISKVGKTLNCSIEDNGVGRAKSTEMRAASVLKHKSMGMQITEERLKAMGRIKGSQVEIEDLIDKAGQACGTRVTVRFPYKLKKS